MPACPPPPEILILDDHPMMAHSVQACLGALQPHACIVSAHSLAQARALLLERGAPGLVIADLNLPDSQGLATLAAVKTMAPDAQVVVFSALDDPATAQAALAMGARRVLAKSGLAHHFVEEIQQCLSQRDASPAAPGAPDPAFGALSKRQQCVLALLANGLSNRDIAAQLNISEATVCTHVADILHRMKVQNRTQASARYLAWAHDHGVAA